MARIVTALLIAIIMTGILASAWFVLQPALTFIAIQINENLRSQGKNTTETENAITLSKLVINVTIPLLIVGVWLWALNWAQREDWRGYPYEG